MVPVACSLLVLDSPAMLFGSIHRHVCGLRAALLPSQQSSVGVDSVQTNARSEVE